MRALLDWYVAAGVDEAIAAEPRNRFEAAAAQPPEAASAQPPTPPPAPLTAPSPAASAPQRPTTPDTADTRALAAACATLAELRAAIAAFDGCALKRTASNTVVGDGDENARLMVIGEAPGAEEDRQGLPFVGPAGKLLDRMLAAIGLARAEVYISNILPWRPPGNRSPTAEEIALCQPFIERQIALVRPRIVMLVGGISAKTLFDETQGITRLRGAWREIEAQGMDAPVPAIATFHPAYLLRQPAAKREVWRDLLAVRKKLEELKD
jgi:uracil-DNA glycosylase family 4